MSCIETNHGISEYVLHREKYIFPDMPCMSRVYKDKANVGALVSSQERGALAVPRINPGSTAGFVPLSVYIGFRLFVLLKRYSEQLSSVPRGLEVQLFLGRTDPSASRLARPRPAPLPRRAPPRPDPPVVCPGFGLDR